MILLQTRYLAASQSPEVAVYFGIGIVIVAILVIAGVLVGRARAPRTAADQAQYSSFVFRRTGKALGLPPSHVEALENLVRATKVKQPFLVFSSPGLLDDVLKKGLYSLDNARGMAEGERERRKAILFQTKQIMESSARKSISVKSTHFMKPGQSLTLTVENGGAFPSKVVSNMKDFLTVAAPPAAAQGNTRWTRGTRLSVYFWRENDAGYSFASKILGYDTVKGVQCILIQHGKALRRQQRRRNRRKPIMRPCFYYPIRIEESGQGRKATRKAVVENRLGALGTVVDLSGGGCAVQTLTPMDPGKLIMIEFDIDKKAPIRAFGKVKRVRRMKSRGGVMHVMFTNVTRQYLNRIFEFVYDFSRPPGSIPAGTRPPGTSPAGGAGRPRPAGVPPRR
jgi:c-di-GMP-binding flagellar brake protein YcgR